MRRLLAWPLVRAQFAWHGIDWGAGWKVFGRPIIQKHRGSRITLENSLRLRSWHRSNSLVPTPQVVAGRPDAQRWGAGDGDAGFLHDLHEKGGGVQGAGDRCSV